MKSYSINDNNLVVSGRFVRVASLRDEFFAPLENHAAFIADVRSSGLKADLLTFVLGIDSQPLIEGFHQEHDSMAVLPLTTYDHWLNNQITSRPRNKLKKALKSGIEVRPLEFNDDLVRRIMEVYNENPVRQGQRNLHFGKDFKTVKREHEAFLDRSDFVGVFSQSTMIGFAKVVHTRDYSILMKILAMISHRDKAPTNALLAKIIEVCANRKSPCLIYSVWGKRPGLNEFKEANGFQRREVRRYYVPLTTRGSVLLKLNLHRSLKDYLPDKCVVLAGDLRTKWIDFRYGGHSPQPSGQ